MDNSSSHSPSTTPFMIVTGRPGQGKTLRGPEPIYFDPLTAFGGNKQTNGDTPAANEEFWKAAKRYLPRGI